MKLKAIIGLVKLLAELTAFWLFYQFDWRIGLAVALFTFSQSLAGSIGLLKGIIREQRR